MSGDVQVRICESLGVRFPRATRLVLGFQHREEADRFLEQFGTDGGIRAGTAPGENAPD